MLGIVTFDNNISKDLTNKDERKMKNKKEYTLIHILIQS